VVDGSLGAAEKLTSITRMWREYLVQHQAVFEFLINDQAAKQRLPRSRRLVPRGSIRWPGSFVRAFRRAYSGRWRPRRSRRC
jgi:hypothetical protein